ncbi:MAG: universal stress protein [Candidatus Omnitrophica bacterium]|nr:universal stress protein [Candidatus Omnitrophota bacterium]
MPFKTILVPVDFSWASKRALQEAVVLGKEFSSKLILLHVVKDLPITSDYVSLYASASSIFDKMKNRALLDIKKWTALAKASGVRAEAIVRLGEPFLEIIKMAKAKRVQLIVMGTHGRTGLEHVLIGSVAERVVRKAPCPVLTVKGGKAAFRHP